MARYECGHYSLYSTDGVGEVIDFMPMGLPKPEFGYQSLIRRVRVARSRTRFRLVCQPAFNFTRDVHATRLTDQGVCFEAANLSLGVTTPVSLRRYESVVQAEFTVSEVHSETFVLREIQSGTDCGHIEQEEGGVMFHQRVEYWRHWLAQCTHAGRRREMVYRSALTRDLLTY